MNWLTSEIGSGVGDVTSVLGDVIGEATSVAGDVTSLLSAARTATGAIATASSDLAAIESFATKLVSWSYSSRMMPIFLILPNGVFFLQQFWIFLSCGY